MQIIVALILNATALMATAYVVPGFKVDNFTTALLAGLVLGVVNTFIRPFVALITAPLTFLTLGLFAFVVNAAMLFVVTWFVPGFALDGWVPAILGAVVLAVVSAALSMLLKDLAKIKLGK